MIRYGAAALLAVLALSASTVAGQSIEQATAIAGPPAATPQRLSLGPLPRPTGKRIALFGVIAALIGLCGSLFLRPRRVWVRARRHRGEAGVGDTPGQGGTMVEVALLDRSGGADLRDVLDQIVTELQADVIKESR